MRKVLAFLFGIALIVLLYVISSVELTNREVTLFSTALAILAMAISWLVTDIYYEKSKKSAIDEVKKIHTENLKTYVINASEKVNNISNELNRLSKRLKDIGSNYSNNNPDPNVMKEQVASITHVIETLKSVNDTTINDWRGVIGGDIKTFRQTEEELKRKEIDNLLFRIENLEAIGNVDEESAKSAIDIRKHLDNLLSDTGVVINPYKKLQHVTRKCPKCLTTIGYDQHTRKRNKRTLMCPKVYCNTLLISEYDEIERKFNLFAPNSIDKNVECERCHSRLFAKVPDYKSMEVKKQCDCGNVVRFFTIDGIVHTKQSYIPPLPKVEVDEEIISKVKGLLPTQPWEKDVHKVVANELGVSNSCVQKAIKRLIRRGEVYDQVDGQLYKYEKVDIA